MTLFDAFVIYLAAGAPFGVLVFMSRQNERYYRALAGAVAAIGLWPILAASRLAKTAARNGRTRLRSEKKSDRMKGALSVTEALPKRKREVTERFTALSELAQAAPDEPAELFEIAGHPNPMLATLCNARRRHSVVLRHLEEAQQAIDELENEPQISSLSENGPPIINQPEPVQSVYGSMQA